MLVSVLLPVYNVAPYLPQCLDSILNQTYGNLQVVLVDDGSIDNSWHVCQEYSARDRRVEIFHQKNQGVAVTRNNLLSHVRGDFVLFVDSDDWIELDMIDYLVRKASATESKIVVCSMVKNDTKVKEEYTERLLEQHDIIEKFLFHRELTGSLCNKLIKASLLQGVSFVKDVSYGEDALFCWQIFKQFNGRMLLTDREFYHYRMNDNSISHSFGKLKFTAYKVWQSISEDTARLYPDLLPVAQGKFCSEMTVILYDAARNGCQADQDTKQLCRIVKKYHRIMYNTGLSSVKKYIMALVLSYQYPQVRLFYKCLYKFI